MSTPGISRGNPVLHFTQRTSIRARVLRQSVLLVSFCVLLLGGLSFRVVTSFLTSIKVDPDVPWGDPRALGATILLLSALLLVLAFLLSTLLAGTLTRSIQELAEKARKLRPGAWIFAPTVQTGDEVEALDRVFADLAGRLQNAYERLEEKVQERTKALREEYALDRAMLESVDYGILAFDVVGRVTEVNPAACDILRRERAELIGEDGATALPLVQRHQQAIAAGHPLTSVLATQTKYRSHPSQHMSLSRADGTVLPVTVLIAPLLQKKRLFGAIAVIADVSVERQIDYMKSEFISLASHQLRTPLSTIRWHLEMLQGAHDANPDTQREYLSEIDTAAKRMANLLEALLHVARLEGGGLQPAKESLDLFAFLRKIVGEWKQAADEQHVPFCAELPHRELRVTTDPVLLQIVLQNIFNNALKYSPEKTPIHLSVDAADRRIAITIEDHGVGIPAGERKRLFQKFFRAKNVRKMDTDGTGLGLYMSKTIMENLGGDITFESTEGKGSRFTVTVVR